MSKPRASLIAVGLCAVAGNCGPNGEPLACGYEPDHDGDHSWATLPTFFNGHTALERAAIEYVEASRAWADVVAETGRLNDAKHPASVRRMDALVALEEAVCDGR